MISSDYHVHSSFSTDSDAPPSEVLNAAVSLGLKSVCLTDHMDCEWPEDPELFIFDTDEYFKALTKLKEEYKDRLDLRIGMELGLRSEPDVYAFLSESYKKYQDMPFDFIIGSTHVFDYGDPYYTKFWEDKNPDSVVNSFYESTLFNASHYDCYDVYGHIDYITRYLPDGCHYEQSRYAELIEAILKAIINGNRGIEINTASLTKGYADANPNASVIKLYKELGGEIITVGSDAHSPENLTAHFDTAATILKDCGFKYYTEFVNRKPVFLEL